MRLQHSRVFVRTAEVSSTRMKGLRGSYTIGCILRARHAKALVG